jgi:D-beta-D-heptose 7-phosphate kinase / D-beta-D-heptose 1-phosphate adenosyltransferase
MFDSDARSDAIARQTVLCVGDLMLDEFACGEVSRISPEAPAQVIAVQRTETNVGGAGNVARNIASLGARRIFVRLIGEDETGAKLKAALARESLIESTLVCDSVRPTTRKVRFVSEDFSTHMLRADWESALPASADIEQKLIDAILSLMPRADIVLLSDYAKGVLTARMIRNVIDAARKLGEHVIVDPKSANFAIYRGATLLTPNRKELAEAIRSRADTEESIAEAAQDAIQLADCEAMLVTQSEHGMTRVPRKGEAIHVPAHPVKVREVSRAGDTVAAVLAMALAAGADWETAKVLTAARGACVIAGLNSDASVTRLEGEGHPVHNERARSEVLEAIDLVVIFEEDTPLNLITQMKPSGLAKGGGYAREQVIGHEVVVANGGEIVLIDILEGFSTTSHVRRARESHR